MTSAMKNMHFLNMPVAALLAALLLSCADWRDVRPLDLDIRLPEQEAPALWETYQASLRAYKQRPHTLLYARLANAPEKAVNERSFLRSLPDSLDIVTLTNADRFSAFDAEDMAWMKAVGTKVLYLVDLALSPDAAALKASLDRAVASVRGNGLDGYACTAAFKLDDPAHAALVSTLVSTLRDARADGQLLVFEGDPLAVPAELRDGIDRFVLSTQTLENTYDITRAVRSAMDRCGLPASRLLLAATVGGEVADEHKATHPAVEELAGRVVSYGNLAGLAVFNAEADYYHFGGNYTSVRAAIQQLNPSK